jgi:uncharacterized membrane-anchored protein
MGGRLAHGAVLDCFRAHRPLGATVGDFLDKPFDHGGLAPSRYTASATLAATMVHLIVPLPQRAEQHSA